MSTQQPKTTLTIIAEAMQDQLDDPLRNDITKARSLGTKTGCDASKIARILKRLANGQIDGIDISVWDGKRSNSNRLYRIHKIKRIPDKSVFITKEQCAEMRNKFLDSNLVLRKYADGHRFSRSQIRKHITGECNHNIDAVPVRGNHNQTPAWTPREE